MAGEWSCYADDVLVFDFVFPVLFASKGIPTVMVSPFFWKRSSHESI